MRTSQLFENTVLTEQRSYLLWESVGIKIKEAALTADQIQDLFRQVEQGATAGGGNRTAIGKGKDVAVAVKQAYDDLVSKVQNSAPMQNADAKYDEIAAKLKDATGGDNGVMQYVQKYRDFAKKHPIAQGFIYSALIAAAGISGVGAGGAAVLGLLKMADKLLQGEKFSTALGKGLATGATAFAAGQLGKAMQGDQAGAADAAQAASGGLQRVDLEFWKNSHFGDDLNRMLNDPTVNQAFKDQLVKQLNKSLVNPDSTPSVADAWRLAKKLAHSHSGLRTIYDNLDVAFALGINLSERQIRIIFGTTQGIMLQEGVWDSVKSGAKKVAGAVADKVKTVGHNLTTKITADKLNKAWKDAGSPTDSDQLAQFLVAQGVDKSVVDSVYQQLSLPIAQTTASQTAPTQAPVVDIEKLKASIMQLDAATREGLLKYIQGQLGTA